MDQGCRVLLVDDEPALLSLLGQFLGRKGYSVRSFLTAEQAQAAIGAEWVPDLLVVDYKLPGMSGTGLADLLLSQFPHLLCLLCSGYLVSSIGLKDEYRTRTAILQKPFLPAALVDAIEALQSNRTHGCDTSAI